MRNTADCKGLAVGFCQGATATLECPATLALWGLRPVSTVSNRTSGARVQFSSRKLTSTCTSKQRGTGGGKKANFKNVSNVIGGKLMHLRPCVWVTEFCVRGNIAESLYPEPNQL